MQWLLQLVLCYGSVVIAGVAIARTQVETPLGSTFSIAYSIIYVCAIGLGFSNSNDDDNANGNDNGDDDSRD